MDRFIKELESKGVAVLVGAIIGLVVYTFGESASELLGFLKNTLPPSKLIGVIAILLISNLILFVLLRIERNKQKLKYAFGLLWDGEKTPHCNICKNPMGPYQEWHGYGFGFQCTQCDKIVAPTDVNGKTLTYEEARTKI